MKNKSNPKTTCLLFDTCALSSMFSEENILKEYEKNRLNGLKILKRETRNFVVSSLVIHELAIAIDRKNINTHETIKDIILKKLKVYFEPLRIDSIGMSSVDIYPLIRRNNHDNIENKFKHKIDSLIVSHAISYMEKMKDEYSDTILITEDIQIKKYTHNSNLKIKSIEETINYLEIEPEFPFDDAN